MSRTWDTEIELCNVEKGLDDEGFETELLVPSHNILANKKNVYSREYWAAKQNVIELEHVFEVHEFEYSGERGLRYNDTDYKVERTFLNDDGYLELTTSLWSDAHEDRKSTRLNSSH